MQITERALDTITPYEANPRKNDDAVDVVAASIRAYGFRQPIVVDEQGVILAGHTRYRAAQKLKIGTVPVHVAAGLSPEDARAYRIADNQTATKSEWDDELLGLELRTLRDAGADLGPLGFTDDELMAAMGADEGETDPDEIPEPPEEPTTKRGDVWTLGDHRLMCGDSTDAEDVGRLLDGAKPFLMVTDPPYGVEYDPGWRNEAAAKGQIAFAAVREGRVENDDRVDWSEAYKLFGGDVAYVWHAGPHASETTANLDAADFEIKTQIIWRKPAPAISRGHYNWQHEPCWYATRKGRPAKWVGGHSESTVWDISNRLGEDASNHGTQKPVECMARPVRNHGGKGDTVYDPFLGSGTTVIAAQMLGRACFGMELSPLYCDIAVARWERFTGKKAERAESTQADQAKPHNAR